MDYFFIGGIGNCVWNTEHHINKVDLVITLGRGALEAMSCGRNVIVYDYNGGDGMITPESYNEIRQKNFSGRRYSLMYNEQDLMQELCKYTSSFGNANRKIIENNHSVKKNVRELLNIYLEAIKNPIIQKRFSYCYCKEILSRSLSFIQKIVNKYHKYVS